VARPPVTLVEWREATVVRGAFALGPVSLAVPSGELVGVVGPNGSGKSTLLALAAGDATPASGAVLLQGDAPTRLPRAEVARRVALVRQGAPPRLPMTAEELVLHGRWVHLSGWRFPGPRDTALAREALARCRVLELADRDVRTLSGGEWQRVLLARALAQASPLLLLDEPTSSLDLRHRSDAVVLLRELTRDGHGCVIVGHDLDLLAAACDRLVLLRDGRVLGAGPPDVVLTEERLQEAYGLAIRVARDDDGRPRPYVRWGPR
jgi:iron complex transport system ATP-binding protein